MAGDAVGQSNPLHLPSRFGDLPARWSWRRLDDACDGVFDCPHSTPRLVDTGPFVVRSQDIITGVFRTEEAARVSEKTYTERTSRVIPARGDLLYSREGTYFGIAAQVPERTRVCLGQRMVLIRPKPGVVDFRFLCHWLNSPIMASHIHGFRDGSVAERLNLPTIRALPVVVPPLPEQRAIAHILGTLNDKIELNRRMNETLEAMARALFKSWFVDFDPVRAKAEGRLPAGRQATPPPAASPGLPAGRHGKWFVYALECENGSVYIGHSEDVSRRYEEHVTGKGADWTKRHPPRRIAYWEELETQQDAIRREKQLKTGSGREWLKREIEKTASMASHVPPCLPPCLPAGRDRQVADLFPDSFEASELGEIPKGWKVGTLGDVAEHPRRGVQPTDIEPSTPYIALEHMPRRCIALSEWDAADGLESNKFEFKRGEILFGKLRPYFHKVGVAPVDGVCSTDIVVVAPRERAWFGFVLGHVSSDAFVEHTNAGSTGTKMPRTRWAEMARYPVVIPQKTVCEAFTNQIRPASDRIVASIHESRTLAALRDTLLPKLISGELRVNEPGKVMESGGAR